MLVLLGELDNGNPYEPNHLEPLAVSEDRAKLEAYRDGIDPTSFSAYRIEQIINIDEE